MKIVCIGDSLTHGYKVKSSEVWTSLVQDKCRFELLNKGVIGDTTGGMLARFEKDVIGNKPSHVIIMGGTNDLIMEVPLGVILSNLTAMTHQARANKIKPIIGIQLLLEPTIAQKHWQGVANFYRVNEEITELRKRIAGFGNAFDVQIIDFYAEFNRHITLENKLDFYIDGLHPTIKGNEIMANTVRI
ncbi:GDSL-type esterase/lipase family protein [Clostridium magnum]|uniref:Arylesterase n=1 Tax=Clostridium magnum DSM 2767 TaxID=1121326 RepID=A0A161YGE6_9CLOT|nr:GDSL-type esterase/lipase family protein [Clostridium magnum]KZL89212.1 arylesterase precursor [Clostridium magnum DSM 2767]SHJ35842.1 Lysophospholipase L1 [Clostridium magnum DSM 2767]